ITGRRQEARCLPVPDPAVTADLKAEAGRRRAYERFRRPTKPNADRPTPSSANDANGEGFGTGTATGVSENRFSIVSISCPVPRDRASITLRLVTAAKVMGAGFKLEFEAERDWPFGKPVSVTANDPIPVIASDASVIGSLGGAVMVYEIEEAM